MKTRVLFLCLFLLFTLALNLLFAQPEASSTHSDLSRSKQVSPLSELVIALTPTHDPDQVLKSAQPLVTYLEKELGLPVRVQTVTDYQSIVKALESDHIDVAFMPGLPIVLAVALADVTPLCIEIQRGSTSYNSHIYVRADSDIHSLEDLKGKRVAFTDPVSSSGFLYPLSLFYEKDLIKAGQAFADFFSHVHWAGGYETALTAVYNGHVEAGCGSQHATTWYLDEQQRPEIRVLAKAGPLPTHGIVARRELGEPFLKNLQQVLMTLNDPSQKHILKDLYHADGLELADEQTYDSVLQRALTTGLFDSVLLPDRPDL